MRRAVAVALGGLLLLGACGGDDDETTDDGTTAESPEEEADAAAYIEATAGPFREGAAGPVMDDVAADCVAAALVDGVGVDRIVDAGVSPGEFANADDLVSLGIEPTDSFAEELAADLGDCGVAAFFSEAFVGGMSGDFGLELTDADATCVTDMIDSGALLDAVAAVFVDSSDDRFAAVVFDGLAACPNALAGIVIAGLEQESATVLSPAARGCVTTYVTANAQAVVDTMSTEDEAATEQFAIDLSTACPEAFTP